MSTRRRPEWPAFGHPDPDVDPEGYELSCDLEHEHREDYDR